MPVIREEDFTDLEVQERVAARKTESRQEIVKSTVKQAQLNWPYVQIGIIAGVLAYLQIDWQYILAAFVLLRGDKLLNWTVKVKLER